MLLLLLLVLSFFLWNLSCRVTCQDKEHRTKSSRAWGATVCNLWPLWWIHLQWNWWWHLQLGMQVNSFGKEMSSRSAFCSRTEFKAQGEFRVCTSARNHTSRWVYSGERKGCKATRMGTGWSHWKMAPNSSGCIVRQTSDLNQRWRSSTANIGICRLQVCSQDSRELGEGGLWFANSCADASNSCCSWRPWHYGFSRDRLRKDCSFPLPNYHEVLHDPDLGFVRAAETPSNGFGTHSRAFSSGQWCNSSKWLASHSGYHCYLVISFGAVLISAVRNFLGSVWSTWKFESSSSNTGWLAAE